MENVKEAVLGLLGCCVYVKSQSLNWLQMELKIGCTPLLQLCTALLLQRNGNVQRSYWLAMSNLNVRIMCMVSGIQMSGDLGCQILNQVWRLQNQCKQFLKIWKNINVQRLLTKEKQLSRCKSSCNKISLSLWKSFYVMSGSDLSTERETVLHFTLTNIQNSPFRFSIVQNILW